MIAIVDYGMGNVKSVFNALDYLGEDVVVTNDKQKLSDASHIILPGVGAFGKAIDTLNKTGLTNILEKEVIGNGKPFLGICLGMQLIASQGFEYGVHEGFGWVDATIDKIVIENSEYKLPHMGWNDLNIVMKDHALFEKFHTTHSSFYFVHTYQMNLKEKSVLAATCQYENPITAIIIKDNIIATQFHPEKSQDNGIQMLENFINWNP
jgi:imidazole glycerol-phosphate synthase subunit HisH